MTTVFRLPEEPPVGTTVRPEPDTGERWTRGRSSWSQQPRLPAGIYFGVSWGMVLDACKGKAEIVRPLNPTPWTVQGTSDTWITDADGNAVCEIERFDRGYEDARYIPAKRELAERIVKAVNEATP